MKTLKTKIRTLLIGTIFATICLSLFTTNFTYALSTTNNKDAHSQPLPQTNTDQSTNTTSDTSNTPAANDLTNGTFNVTQHLKLDNGQQPKKYFNDSSNSPIVSLIITVIDYAITVMGAIAVILLIAAGFMFMFSNGNTQKLDEAKDIVKYAVIGLIVALLAYVIVIFVQSIFANG